MSDSDDLSTAAEPGHALDAFDRRILARVQSDCHRPAESIAAEIGLSASAVQRRLRRLRERSALPVIFLTSKTDELDEALGLAMGADDYIAKPFSTRLLIARIKAILRRVELSRPQAQADEAAAEPLVRGALVVGV